MTDQTYFTVTVKHNTEKAERYAHVVAVGIGHVLPNLVLVIREPGQAEKVLDIAHARYTAITIRKCKKRPVPVERTDA
jgi:hypothetical protein